MRKIKQTIEESIKLKEKLLDDAYLTGINKISQAIAGCLKTNNKILIAGNGGSAADAQHFAAELAGKFEIEDRQALPAIALSTNSSIITAIGNDFGFDQVFERQIEALGQTDDIFVGISTSGNSNNLIKAGTTAKNKGMKTIALLGGDGGKMKDKYDLSLIVPSTSTPRIQEAQILIIHIICKLIDNEFYER